MSKENQSVRVKPQWQISDDNKLVILNEKELTKEQKAYLKTFLAKKTFTKEDRQKLIAAIKANESATPEPAKSGKKESKPKSEPKVDVSDEVAPTKSGKQKNKIKDDKKAEKSKSEKKQPKKLKSFKEGDVVVVSKENNLGVRVLAENSKVKVGMYAYIPDYPEKTGDTDAPDDVFLEVALVLDRTIYFLEHESENLLGSTKKSANAHFIDDSGEIKGDNRIPFYLCELVDLKQEAKNQEVAKKSEKAASKSKDKDKESAKPEKSKVKGKDKGKKSA